MILSDAALELLWGLNSEQEERQSGHTGETEVQTDDQSADEEEPREEASFSGGYSSEVIDQNVHFLDK